MTDLELYRIALVKELQKKIDEKEKNLTPIKIGEVKGLNQALALANKMANKQ